ncbi:hypothetical protein JTB14_013913 [Gonioctena quinquepunctata]|nr:hypothetical protein JTB14_013913 [Gonioctena quinquepunctata]
MQLNSIPPVSKIAKDHPIAPKKIQDLGPLQRKKHTCEFRKLELYKKGGFPQKNKIKLHLGTTHQNKEAPLPPQRYGKRGWKKKEEKKKARTGPRGDGDKNLWSTTLGRQSLKNNQ